MTNSAQVLLIPLMFVVPAYAQHRGGSTSVEPEKFGTSTRSGLLRNRRFAFARLGLAPCDTLVPLAGGASVIWAGAATPRPLS